MKHSTYMIISTKIKHFSMFETFLLLFTFSVFLPALWLFYNHNRFYSYWARIGLKVTVFFLFCFLNILVLQIIFFEGMTIDISNVRCLITFNDNSCQWIYWVIFILLIFICETVIKSHYFNIHKNSCNCLYRTLEVTSWKTNIFINI